MPHMFLKMISLQEKCKQRKGKVKQRGLLHTDKCPSIASYIHLFTLENFVVLTCDTC